MSAANRRRGHDAERAVAAWLRDRGWPDARTTRSALGHDGAHAPGDIEAIPGLVIEVKDVAGSRWPSWARQAEAEAYGRPWIVIRRRRGTVNVGDWDCLTSEAWAHERHQRSARSLVPVSVALAEDIEEDLWPAVS